MNVLPTFVMVAWTPDGDETDPRTRGAGIVSVTAKSSQAVVSEEHSTLKLYVAVSPGFRERWAGVGDAVLSRWMTGTSGGSANAAAGTRTLETNRIEASAATAPRIRRANGQRDTRVRVAGVRTLLPKTVWHQETRLFARECGGLGCAT